RAGGRERARHRRGRGGGARRRERRGLPGAQAARAARDAPPPGTGVSVAKHVVVVGSGAGGSAAAWVLASAGFQVTVLEKGPNYFRGLDAPGALPFPLFGGDEIRVARGFPGIDVLAEPRTSRSQSEAEDDLAHSYVGDVNHLSHTVGGGTTHWDAKVPR